VISNSSSTGRVSSDGDYTGGLVGANSWFEFRETPTVHGTIEDCFSTGPVTGKNYVGGLVAFNIDSARTARCYSTGTVSGSSNLGGLIGFNNGTVVDSFWDRQSSNIVSSAGGLGLDTVEMKQRSSYPGWDFNRTWNVDEGASYPELRMSEGSIPSEYLFPIISHQDYLTLEAYTSNPVHFRFKAYHAPSDNDLVWSMQSKFSWLSIDSNTGVLYGVPAFQDIRTSEHATVTVTDAKGRSNSTRIVISVFQGPPAWVTVPGNTEIRPGDDFDFNVSASCSEPNHTIAYGITSVPVIGITVDFASGRILWRNAQAGNYTITVTASSFGHTASHTFRLKVGDTTPAFENRPPVWASVPSDKEMMEGDEYRFLLRASDVDIYDSIAYGLEPSAPAGLMVNSTTGELLWLNVPAGNHCITLTASDGRVVIRHQFVLHVLPSADVNRHTTITSDAVPGSAASVVVASGVIAVVLGLAVAASTEVGKYGLLGFLMPLYTRLRREEVLDNETRGMIRGFIMADPGIHFNEIQRRFRLGNGHLAHHLMTLEREGFIKSRADGYLRRFYPADMKIGAQPPRLPKIQRIILETVQESEGLSERDIARVLDMAYSTANRHVNKLAELGFLRLEKQGMTVKCYLVGKEGKNPP
jgi:predicted transcriptional regulator